MVTMLNRFPESTHPCGSVGESNPCKMAAILAESDGNIFGQTSESSHPYKNSCFASAHVIGKLI